MGKKETYFNFIEFEVDNKYILLKMKKWKSENKEENIIFLI